MEFVEGIREKDTLELTELLKKQGAYSRLYTAQKQLETLETEDA